MKIATSGVDMTGKAYILRPATGRTIDLTGMIFDKLTVIGYAGKKLWLCLCECNNIKLINGDSLKSGKSCSCGCKTTGFKDITGQVFGDLKVLGKAIDKNGKWNNKWTCECTCGTIKDINGHSLRSGETTSCGHNTTGFKDLTGQTFGELKVLEYIGDQYYKVQCSCNEIYNVYGPNLRAGRVKSCGHDIKQDLTGKILYNWQIIEYVTDKDRLKQAGIAESSFKETWVLCRCACGRQKIINLHTIRSGKSQSCGHCNQTDEQLSMIATKENFIIALELEAKRLNRKPYISEIAQLLGLKGQSVSRYIDMYNARQYVEYLNTMSEFELQVKEFISSLGIEYISNDRNVLNPKELDIFIPDKHLAIECNGDYHHDSTHKSKDYHQNKTLQCLEKGIYLIHIFEHEWKNESTHLKIKNLIKQSLGIYRVRLYARNTVVKEIPNYTANDFLNKYHLQGIVNATTCLGLYYNNELVQVMTFGRSRFNSNYDVELLRLCTKADYLIVGGASKLFKYYINKYKVKNIVSYCDISKFTGNVYEQLGFKYDGLTAINYMYADHTRTIILNRLQCTKQKLIENKWGTEEQTEEEIMAQHNYVKIYSCGNKRYIWQRA